MLPPVEDYINAKPTYPDVGMVRTGRVPAGYHRLHHRSQVGAGDGVWARAADAVLTWQMHRAAGMRVDATAPRAATGVTLVGSIGRGPLRMAAPCRVVWAAEPRDDGLRAGFAYGTLPGHPERGEEAFLVEQAGDGSVWLTVEAFSQPATWYARVGGPVVPLFQMLWARRCAASLRRLIAAQRSGEPA
jgi:uncharacterized protein (UPF0548 family)